MDERNSTRADFFIIEKRLDRLRSEFLVGVTGEKFDQSDGVRRAVNAFDVEIANLQGIKSVSRIFGKGVF